MNTDWDAAIKFVLEAEGGYTLDPNDRGGETMFGVARNHHPSWIGWAVVDAKKNHQGFPDTLNNDHELLNSARDLYKTLFWDVCRCDELPSPLAIAVFDSAVNQGINGTARMLQIALGVTVDGVIGEKTVAAAHKSDSALRRFMAQRMARYIRFILKEPTQEVFADNWSNRLMKLAKLVFSEIQSGPVA